MKINYRLGILFMVCLGAFLVSCQNDVKFDSEKWKKSGGENITLDLRANMVKDLIDSRILINKSKMEIAELIGNPEKLQNKNNGNYRYYPVQEKYGWDIDPEELIFLEIHYNERGVSDSVKHFTTK